MTRAIPRATFALLSLAILQAPLAALATMPGPDGRVPVEVSNAFAGGVFGLPPARPATGTSAARADWLVPVILVGFSDSTLRYRDSDFQQALFDTTRANPTGSFVDYYD